jgi:hypothetical protein
MSAALVYLTVFLQLLTCNGYHSHHFVDFSYSKIFAKNSKENRNDREMKEALQYLENHKKKPKIKPTSSSPLTRLGPRGSSGKLTNADTKALSDMSDEDFSMSKPKSPVYAKQTIWGQNIINCRSFNIDGRRTFEFTGSYVSAEAVPTFALPEISFLGIPFTFLHIYKYLSIFHI